MINEKRVLVLHTGGTIGSIETPDGKTPAKSGDFSDLVKNHPKFKDNDELPSFEIIELEPLISSTNATPKEWQRLSHAVFDNYYDYDGIVITHGTDTLSYSAAALAFSLQNVNKPIIVTGAQIPFFEKENDAENNLYRSLQLASLDIQGVFVFFYDRLMHATRSVKINADEYMGFDSPRSKLIGRYTDNKFVLDPEFKPKDISGDLKYHPYKDVAVSVIHLFPGITVDFLRNALSPLPQGLVVETYGIGNAPCYDEMVSLFREIIERGCATVFVSECLIGTAQPGPYVENTTYQKTGVICGYDMTTPATVTKLHHLLSLNINNTEIKKRMMQSIAEEILEKTP